MLGLDGCSVALVWVRGILHKDLRLQGLKMKSKERLASQGNPGSGVRGRGGQETHSRTICQAPLCKPGFRSGLASEQEP